ncbi:hypothetical protein KEM52_003190 [Ascosphaera acerosa]|nr:hypothetical protein KEM52_003190 [Ascosphaera acerosa]
MADRFPSLDEIDQVGLLPADPNRTDSPSAGQTEVKPTPTGASGAADEDASDFLARERAALGDDADLFAADAPTTTATAGAGIDDDLLGGDVGGDGDGDASTVTAQTHGATPDASAGSTDILASSAAHTVPIMQRGGGPSPTAVDADTTAFESAFPAVETGGDAVRAASTRKMGESRRCTDVGMRF